LVNKRDASVHLTETISNPLNNGSILATWSNYLTGPTTFASFEPNVECSVSVIPLQHRSCSVCISFVRLGHHN